MGDTQEPNKKLAAALDIHAVIKSSMCQDFMHEDHILMAPPVLIPILVIRLSDWAKFRVG
jgi:hypothetical protein